MTVVLQQLFEVSHVVVTKGEALRARNLYAHQDTVMGVFVMQHYIFRTQKMSDETDVGPMTADHDQGVIDAVEFRNALLKVAVQGPLSRDDATGGNRVP